MPVVRIQGKNFRSTLQGEKNAEKAVLLSMQEVCPMESLAVE